MKPDLRQQLNRIITNFVPPVFLLGFTFALVSYVLVRCSAPKWIERLEKNAQIQEVKP